MNNESENGVVSTSHGVTRSIWEKAAETVNVLGLSIHV